MLVIERQQRVFGLAIPRKLQATEVFTVREPCALGHLHMVSPHKVYRGLKATKTLTSVTSREHTFGTVLQRRRFCAHCAFG
jgi:hypothetical protein